jgi:hypothetical protein
MKVKVINDVFKYFKVVVFKKIYISSSDYLFVVWLIL